MSEQSPECVTPEPCDCGSCEQEFRDRAPNNPDFTPEPDDGEARESKWPEPTMWVPGKWNDNHVKALGVVSIVRDALRKSNADIGAFRALDSLMGRAIDAGNIAPTSPPSEVSGETDMICEVHPELPWPHGDCLGPGCPESSRKRLVWVERRRLRQRITVLESFVANGVARIKEMETSEQVLALAPKVDPPEPVAWRYRDKFNDLSPWGFEIDREALSSYEGECKIEALFTHSSSVEPDDALTDEDMRLAYLQGKHDAHSKSVEPGAAREALKILREIVDGEVPIGLPAGMLFRMDRVVRSGTLTSQPAEERPKYPMRSSVPMNPTLGPRPAAPGERGEPCPKCGAQIVTVSGFQPMHGTDADATFCPECGWDADAPASSEGVESEK